MACSLALFRQRAASRARAEALDQVLWDLLQGSVEHRIAARARASELGLSLAGALRVLCCRIENLEELASERGWDTSHADRVRRDVVRALPSSTPTAPSGPPRSACLSTTRLRYRLGRIQQLTGLDLGHHEDRMRADLALRLLQVNAGLDREDMLPESSAWGQ